MFTVDLCSNSQRHQPASRDQAQELLRLAVDLARAKPEAAVRIPTGPARRDRAVVDGEILADDGLEVF